MLFLNTGSTFPKYSINLLTCPIGNRFTAGRNALINLWTQQQEQGVNHVALNLKPSRRPAEEIMQELAEFVLPQFRNQ